MTARYVVGDVRQVLRSLPDNSVDLVLTSPPFLALRSYLPADHPDKALEMGSEPTPGEFIDGLLDVVEECRRVLAPHGSVAIELGDTYSGSGGGGGDYLEGGMREGQQQFAGSAAASMRESNAAHWRQKNADKDGWPEAKSLTLIPELFRLSLAYGRNPLTGRETPRWRVRNVVRWCRPNPPVGALGDKFRPATSDMVIACVARDRYFDLDAVRQPMAEHTAKYNGGARPHYGERGGQGTVTEYAEGMKSNPAGAPPLDWWKISTQPYAGSHYATWPEQLCITPIKSMCPPRVCTTCGQPSRRIISDPDYINARSGKSVDKAAWNEGDLNRQGAIGRDNGALRQTTTLGWTDCKHGTWRTGVTLDPFAGSGTTLAVATGHGRDAIGIDLDSRNAELAVQRVGPLILSVEYHEEAAA